MLVNMFLKFVLWTILMFTFIKASFPDIGPTEAPDMESGSGMILTGKMFIYIYWD